MAKTLEELMELETPENQAAIKARADEILTWQLPSIDHTPRQLRRP